MKTLPLNLRKNRFNYSQVYRGKRSCFYAQEVSPGHYYYEVFLLKIRPEHEYKEEVFPAMERFPPNEAFGKWAWSYQTYKRALKAFNRLEESTSAGRD